MKIITMKYKAIAIKPIGKAKRAYSKLVILSLPAAIIFGILHGISIPPLIISPIKMASIVFVLMAGLISAAASVALSKIADNILIQYKMSGLKSSKYLSINGSKPAPKKVKAITNKYIFKLRTTISR